MIDGGEQPVQDISGAAAAFANGPPSIQELGAGTIAKLMGFYKRHDPSKASLEHAQMLLSKYSIAKIQRTLRKKWGPTSWHLIDKLGEDITPKLLAFYQIHNPAKTSLQHLGHVQMLLSKQE